MYYSREMNTFNVIKEEYNACREFERKKILNYLSKKGLKVSMNGGHGSACYTNSGKLERNYDLTNWKWVEVYIGEKTVFISLQPFDYDRNTKNFHVLMDRIGICTFDKGMKEKEKDYLNTMQVTSFELPLSEEDLCGLYKLIIQMAEGTK